MGITISLIAIVALVLISWIGSSVPGLQMVFAVIIPIASIAFFLIGILARVFKWASAPVPFNITTTAGQQKSHDWIKQNKLDSPSGFWGVVGRMALEVLIFRSLFRNTKAGILDKGSKLVYGAEKWLWAFALAFHWSFLIIVLRHFRFFTEPAPFFVDYLQIYDSFFQIGLPLIYITDVAILAALTYLFFRRVFNKQVEYISLSSDYFPLLLIASIAITGVLMRYFFKTDIIAVKELMTGLFSFHIVVPAGISPLFYVHLFLVCILIAYFPFSKLVHFAGVFFSPTRNMANNNRAKRHVNPWNDELNMQYHTYEQYEDEFRGVMKGVGLPLDKEEGTK